MTIEHFINLSTTEPNNDVGIIKIRQSDEQTQTLVVQITENGVPKDFTGYQPFFCAKLGQTAGLGIIEQKVTGPMNPANGTLEYVMQPEDWQKVGRQIGYFAFRKMKNDHEWTEQFTTRDFTYNVIPSVTGEIREVKKDGSTYVWTIEDMLRLFNEYMAAGKTDWEEFVEQNREVLESVDPGGKLIGELIDARTDNLGHTYLNLKERLDTDKNEFDNLRNEVDDARINYPSLKERLEIDNQFVDNIYAKVIKIENDLVITPDNFEGSDLEKLQQVFEYAIDNNIMKINLTRKYDITGGSIYFPRGVNYPFNYMVFDGGEIIKKDPGYVFTSLDNNNKRTAPSFINTKFSTTADNCYLYDGDKCIRQSVESCDFKRMGLIKSSSYIQTLRIINCETAGLGCDFVSAKKAYDFEMAFHKGESSGTYSLINIVTDKTNEISFLSLRITDSLFEGFPNTCPIILGTGYGLKINGCYYEANKGSIKFVKSVGVDRLSGQIENCIFNGGLDDDGDVIFDGVTNLAFLLFSGITSNVQSPKYFTNTHYTGLQTKNMNLYSGGKLTNGTMLNKEYKSYDVSQIDKQGDGIEFEVKLNLRREGLIGQQLNKQFLFNAKFNYGSTLYYSAHLTGILSFDGYWKSDKVVLGLNVRLLSERNTSGNNNGNTENTPVYDYYFKETGTKEILPNATVATVVFKFPHGKYNASTNINSFTFKGINDMMAEGVFDI